MQNFRKITEHFFVAPQISVEDVAAAREAGFDVMIMNRPAGETPDQPDNQDIVDAIAAQNMVFLHIPIIAPPEIPDMNATLAALDEFEGKKILAFCRSGTRSATLWAYAMAKSNRMEVDDILKAVEAAGYDLTGHRPRLIAASSLD